MKKVLNEFAIEQTIQSIIRKMSSYGIENSCFIGILKGGSWLTFRIINSLPDEIARTVKVGFLGLSSYEGELVTQEKISLTYPLDLDLKEVGKKNLWILDDIFDSGLTLTSAKGIIELEAAKEKMVPANVRTVVLVNKMKPKVELHRNTNNFPDISGFEYFGDGFLVGCGMGQGERYRALNALYELEPEEIAHNTNS